MSRHWDPALGWTEDHDWSQVPQKRGEFADIGELIVAVGWVILLVILLRGILWP